MNNKLSFAFIKCVANCTESKMVITTNEKDGVGDDIYWLVYVNDIFDTNSENCGEFRVVITKCFTDKCDDEWYEYETYEEGFEKIKELVANGSGFYVEGY